MQTYRNNEAGNNRVIIAEYGTFSRAFGSWSGGKSLSSMSRRRREISFPVENPRTKDQIGIVAYAKSSTRIISCLVALCLCGDCRMSLLVPSSLLIGQRLKVSGGTAR